jgi:Nif-specific regulatory protein/two-component system response regulator AtoC
VQSVKLAEEKGCAACDDHFNYIGYLGLTAGGCLERAARVELGLADGRLDADAYARVIVHLKNRIGGTFTRSDGEPGMVRVENTRCPFGERVKEAPELCRMTSSVFGGIAARNFGYAKVELRRRIATHDGRCEVCVYTDPKLAAGRPGDEYRSADGVVIARRDQAEVSARVAEKMHQAWCAGPRGADGRTGAERPVVIAASNAMRSALEAAELVAPTKASVFVTGETGVGKEIVARAIHALSQRAARPFIPVNCGAIPGELIESLLFGHEKGAFTGAHDVHQGVFERAEGGTLFLDEIDSLPVSAQAKLLRVLQEGDFERVGGRHLLRADARVVAASNRDVASLVQAGAFRTDLYYRLNVVPIRIPPLRERREDLAELVRHILRRLAERYDGPRKVLGERAWPPVMSYDWPGNVRELENVLERAYLFSRDAPVIDEVDIPNPAADTEETPAAPRLQHLKRLAAEEVEARTLREALARLRGNVSAVAREIGITPRSVHHKLRAYRIDAASYRRGESPEARG